MRYCIFCGVNIPPDAKYCQICGKEQPTNTQTSADEPPEEKKEGLTALLDSPKKMIMVGIGAFLLVFALITGIMIMVLN